MNQTPAESASFYRELVGSIEIPPNIHLFVFPPMTSLAAVKRSLGSPASNLGRRAERALGT